MQKILVAASFLALVLFLLPQFSFAAGIVPCKGSDADPTDVRPTCTVCDLAKLANNIISWLVSFSFMAGALMVVYGGYLIMTAGLSPKQYEEGKGIIYAAAMGLAIVLVSWALINTVIYYLTGRENWWKIECDLAK